MNRVLIVSPHLDDAVLSCGEFIAQLTENDKEVFVITVFAECPPYEMLSGLAKRYHGLCGFPVHQTKHRKMEDENAMTFFNVDFLHLEFYECIYRMNSDGCHRYNHVKEIFSEDLSKDIDTLETLGNRIKDIFRQEIFECVFAPLGIGRHIDHIITKKCVEEAVRDRQINLFYYEDVPYVCYGTDSKWESDFTDNLSVSIVSIGEDEWRRKIEGIEFYRSQLNALWKKEEQRCEQLNSISQRYLSGGRSIRFWGRCRLNTGNP